MASSSCHVDVTEMKYEVFISFRGRDVRRGLLSHLTKELQREGIDFYVDDRLERGDQISSSLLRAIEGSHILLVIFSEDYASSKWCLNELVEMIECMQRNKQIVVPIFYKVDPSYVRHQKGDYGAALAEYEKKEGMVKVKNWRLALNKAAQLSGFPYPLNSELKESDLVDKIVKDVSNKLSTFCLSEADNPTKSNGLVGSDQNIAWIKSLLTTESKEVIKLGIWGMGGIGKTTIARFVFDTFSPKYEGCYFLENMRDKLKNCQLRSLQDELVSKLVGENSHIDGAGKANSSTMRRLSKKKVLIVLDDVNTPELLKDFLEPICFGLGSRVMVTSRDKQVFTTGGFHVHKVRELNIKESLELFCTHAFNESRPKVGYEELSKRAVAIVKGIPLALKVLGSHLHSKRKDIWECAIGKLKKHLDQNIQIVLRLSYDDGLDDLVKNIFLDIAFFFKEEEKDYVIKQLDAWGFHGACGIEALQDKALITISNDNRIQMHDLIQGMGWEIVHQESSDPRKRSRLRDAKEVYDVLKNNKGTNLSVEGMLLDVSQIGNLALNVDSLTRMHNLRLLKLYSPLPIKLSTRIRHFIPKVTDVQMDYLQILHAIIVKKIGIAKQVVKLQQVPMTDLPKLANSNECDGVPILRTNNESGSKQLMRLLNLNIGSVLTELMSLGNEVHIKLDHYLVMDGCSVSKDLLVSRDVGMETLNSSTGLVNNLEFSDILGLQPENVRPNESSLLPEVTRQLDLGIGYTRMELLRYSTENLSSFEFCNSDIDGLQHDTPLKELPFLRATWYHRLFNCWGQDGRKTKLLVLFDGFRYSERISFSSVDLLELSRGLLCVLLSLLVWVFTAVELSRRFCESLLSVIPLWIETEEHLKHAAPRAKFTDIISLLDLGTMFTLITLFRFIEPYSPKLLHLHRNFLRSLSPQFVRKLCAAHAKFPFTFLFMGIWTSVYFDLRFLPPSTQSWFMVIYEFLTFCLFPPLL